MIVRPPYEFWSDVIHMCIYIHICVYIYIIITITINRVIIYLCIPAEEMILSRAAASLVEVVQEDNGRDAAEPVEEDHPGWRNWDSIHIRNMYIYMYVCVYIYIYICYVM